MITHYITSTVLVFKHLTRQHITAYQAFDYYFILFIKRLLRINFTIQLAVTSLVLKCSTLKLITTFASCYPYIHLMQGKNCFDC